MGITVVLEHEDGSPVERLEDPKGFLQEVMRLAQANGLSWTATIDPYGDTTFNYLQVPHLRSEWKGLLEIGIASSSQALLGKIDQLAAQCESQRHLYLKFYGD